jgi:hypothetical protein
MTWPDFASFFASDFGSKTAGINVELSWESEFGVQEFIILMAFHMINFWCDVVLLQQVEDLIDNIIFLLKNAFNFCEEVLEEV